MQTVISVLQRHFLLAYDLPHDFGGNSMLTTFGRVGQKVGPQTRDHNSVKSESIFKKFTGRYLGKFVVKWILKIPPHHAYVATLPCETKVSAKSH